MAALTFLTPYGQPGRIEVGPRQREIYIGRREFCQIRTDHSSVSRCHALVRFHEGRYLISDPPHPYKSPVNGIFVNERRLAAGEVVTLKDQDQILCGKFPVKFLMSDGAHASAGYSSQPGGVHTHQRSSGDIYNRATQPQDSYTSQHGSYGVQQQQKQGGSASPYDRATQVHGGQGSSAGYAQPGGNDAALQAEIAKLKQKLNESERDFKQRESHHQTVVEALNAKIDTMRVQAEQRAQQLKTQREALELAQEKLEHATNELNQAQSRLDETNQGSAQADARISELKREVAQRDQELKLTKQDLGLVRYENGELKEDLENVVEKLQRANEAVRESQQSREMLQEVIEQYESTIQDLRSMLSRKDQEISLLQETLASGG